MGSHSEVKSIMIEKILSSAFQYVSGTGSFLLMLFFETVEKGFCCFEFFKGRTLK